MISFDEFLIDYLKKWKMTLAVIAVCVCMCTAAVKLWGGEITVSPSEEYLQYEKELAWQEEYLEKSVLMSVNPTSIYVETLLIQNIREEDALKNYAVSVDIWDEFETEDEKKYLPELIEWNYNSQTGVAELALRHRTEEEGTECVKYLEKKLLEKYPELEITVGSGRVEADQELQFLQSDWYSRMDYLSNLLELADAGFTIRVSVPAAIVSGGITGVLLSVAVTLLMFMIKRKTD